MSGPPPTPARWNNPSTTTSKLRDSCHACASSKVKCSKEKPKCTRCVKRRTPCEYLVTKRPGRKHSLHKNLTGSYPSQTLNDGVRPIAPSRTNDLSSASSNATQPSPKQHGGITVVSSDMFSSLLSPVDTSLTSVFDTMTTDFDDFFSPSISFPAPNDSNFDILGHSQLFNGSHDSSTTGLATKSALTAPKDTIYFFGDATTENYQPPAHSPPPTISAPFTPTSLTTPSIPTTSKPGQFPLEQDTGHIEYQSTESACACSIRALDLMRRLLSNDSAPCILSGEQSCHKRRGGRSRSVHSVIAMNERTIEAIITMLQCSCSTDSYLLTMASLMVFKVLSEYAAAAHSNNPIADNMDGCSPQSSWSSRTANQTPPCSAHSTDDSDGEDQGRLAAQLVLGELHRVQGLVNQLSIKLKACSPQNTTRMNSLGGLSERRLSMSTEDRASAFSSAMLDQLEPELRMRIRTLSSEIIDLLRRD